MSFNWHDYSLVADDVIAVKENIIKEIDNFPNYIKSYLKEIALSNAKFLRSGFFFLCTKVGEEQDKEKFLKLATAIELFHLATLIHDDVLDDAKTRRNKIAFHLKFDKRVAVLTGDYIFLKCYDIISKYVDLELVKELSQLGLRICSGEINQAENILNKKVSVLSYLKNIARKTASLFSFSFYLGANQSKAEKKIQKILLNAGFSFGMSFQIMDDILDVTKKEKEIGKSILKDISQGLFTLPIIYALKENNKLKKILSRKKLKNFYIKKIVKIIKNSKSIELSQNLATKYTLRALKFINNLPSSTVQNQLKQAISTLLKRNY